MRIAIDCALLYVYGPRGGLFKHATQALRKSTNCSLTKRPWEGVAQGRRSSIAASTGRAARVAIAVLMPFHSMTTTDSVESISGGLAKSPSAMLNPPTSSPKGPGGRV